MESTITQAVLNLGVAGAVVAVFLIWVHRTTSVTIPGLIADREKDLAWAREQLEMKRQEYLASIKEQQLVFQAALKEQRTDLIATLERSEERWRRLQEMLAAEIRALSTEFREFCEETEREHNRRHDQDQQTQHQQAKQAK